MSPPALVPVLLVLLVTATVPSLTRDVNTKDGGDVDVETPALLDDDGDDGGGGDIVFEGDVVNGGGDGGGVGGGIHAGHGHQKTLLGVGSSTTGLVGGPISGSLGPQQRNYQPSVQGFNDLKSDNTPYNIDYKYHDYDRMTKFLRMTSSRFPSLTALYSVGKSVQGRDLWVLVVSASPYEHMLGKPDVKYVANMHGNEAVSRELMLHLIHYLVSSYTTDPYIRWLLENTRIHLMPSMNPDGFEVSKEGTCDGGQGRYNARGFDLNRNFPDYFKQHNKRTQPETEAVKEWVSKIQFVLSGSLHGGALVASYPFDNTPNSLFQSYGSAPSLTPDDDVFKHLSLTYSTNHAKMSRGVACKASSPGFNRGITNGAEWYPLTGGMQDYNYVWFGCMEVTLEISCCKFPPASELPKYWEDNRLALVKFLAEAHRGVHGFVMDENGNPVEKASLKVKTRDVGFQTTKYGEFWRILLPGVYKLEVYADGYVPRDVDFMIVDEHPTLLNVTLSPAKRRRKKRPTKRVIRKPTKTIGKKRRDGPYYRPSLPPQPLYHRGPNHQYPQQLQQHQGAPGLSPAAQQHAQESGIFSTISNGFSSLVTNIFG